MLSERKWLVRRQRDFRGGFSPHCGWVVAAPSGARRWFFSWGDLCASVPFFVMGEQTPGLRESCPGIFDAGVRI